MSTSLHDLRYAVRLLVKAPGFTAVAILTFALGVGANTAVFSVVNSVLLRPLPYEGAEALVRIWGTRSDRAELLGNISPQDFEDWRARSSAFEELGAHAVADVSLTGVGEPQTLLAGRVTEGFFRLLRVRPSLGRTFRPEEDEPGGADVVILSHELWRTRFGSDEDVVGRSITLDGRPHTVIGVAPANFRPPPYSREIASVRDLWLPVKIGPRNGRGGRWLTAIARLGPGATIEGAQAEMDGIMARLEQLYPESNAGRGVSIAPLHEAIVGSLRPALLVLLGAVAFVLLIACVNLSNLLVMRFGEREGEMALRAALGAERGRLVRQLLTESLALAVLGGAVGLLLAAWVTEAIVSLAASGIPRADEVSVDGRVLLFTLALSAAVGLAIGSIAAVGSSHGDAAGLLKLGGRSSAGVGRRRLRSALVVAETALALMLLVGAGLMLKSFWTLRGVDPGFDRESVLTFDLSPPRSDYPGRVEVLAFYDQLYERLAASPGVEGVGAITMLPLRRSASCDGFSIDARPWLSPGDQECAEFRVVGGQYFDAMGIPILRGRGFDRRDDSQSAPIAVINDAMARRYWPGGDPIGERLTYDEPREIVGVVGDVRHFGLASDPRPEVYLYQPQYPWSRSLTVAVKTSGEAPLFLPVVRSEIASIDPRLPLGHVETIESLIAGSIAEPRFRTLLLLIFAGLALALAVVGIYGVTSYAVSRRTREIGVRMALGAQRRDVLRHVMGQGLRLATLGIVIGLAGSFALTRTLSSLLYEVSATDPVTFISVGVLMAAVALAAHLVPGSRATRVDPMEALRHE